MICLKIYLHDDSIIKTAAGYFLCARRQIICLFVLTFRPMNQHFHCNLKKTVQPTLNKMPPIAHLEIIPDSWIYNQRRAPEDNWLIYSLEPENWQLNLGSQPGKQTVKHLILNYLQHLVK